MLLPNPVVDGSDWKELIVLRLPFSFRSPCRSTELRARKELCTLPRRNCSFGMKAGESRYLRLERRIQVRAALVTGACAFRVCYCCYTTFHPTACIALLFLFVVEDAETSDAKELRELKVSLEGTPPVGPLVAGAKTLDQVR